MDSLSKITFPNPGTPTQNPDPLGLNSSTPQEFEKLIDGIAGQKQSKAEAAQAAAQAQAKIDEFEKTIAQLTGQLDHAETALGAAPSSGVLHEMKESDYSFAKSRLIQAELPDGIGNPF